MTALLVQCFNKQHKVPPLINIIQHKARHEWKQLFKGIFLIAATFFFPEMCTCHIFSIVCHRAQPNSCFSGSCSTSPSAPNEQSWWPRVRRSSQNGPLSLATSTSTPMLARPAKRSSGAPEASNGNWNDLALFMMRILHLGPQIKFAPLETWNRSCWVTQYDVPHILACWCEINIRHS